MPTSAHYERRPLEEFNGVDGWRGFRSSTGRISEDMETEYHHFTMAPDDDRFVARGTALWQFGLMVAAVAGGVGLLAYVLHTLRPEAPLRRYDARSMLYRSPEELPEGAPGILRPSSFALKPYTH